MGEQHTHTSRTSQLRKMREHDPGLQDERACIAFVASELNAVPLKDKCTRSGFYGFLSERGSIWYMWAGNHLIVACSIQPIFCKFGHPRFPQRIIKAVHTFRIMVDKGVSSAHISLPKFEIAVVRECATHLFRRDPHLMLKMVFIAYCESTHLIINFK